WEDNDDIATVISVTAYTDRDVEDEFKASADPILDLSPSRISSVERTEGFLTPVARTAPVRPLAIDAQGIRYAKPNRGTLLGVTGSRERRVALPYEQMFGSGAQYAKLSTRRTA